MVGSGVHGDVVPGVPNGPGLHRLRRPRTDVEPHRATGRDLSSLPGIAGRLRGGRLSKARHQLPETRPLGGRGGHDVDEVLVAEAHRLPLPAPVQVGLGARGHLRVGEAHRHPDDLAPVQLTPGGRPEQGQQLGAGADRVVDEQVLVQPGGEDGDARRPFNEVEDVLDDAGRQGRRVTHPDVRVHDGGPRVEDGVVELQAHGHHDVLQRRDRPAGVDDQEVAGRPPPGHGLAVAQRDRPVEDDGAVQIGGDEPAWHGSPFRSGPGGCRSPRSRRSAPHEPPRRRRGLESSPCGPSWPASWSASWAASWAGAPGASGARGPTGRSREGGCVSRG